MTDIPFPIVWKNCRLIEPSLGRGFYGEVFTVLWPLEDRTVRFAVKKLRTSTASSSVEINAETENNNEEFKILRELEHENILRMHSIFVDEREMPYLAMEYMHCGSLYKYLHEENHPVENMSQVALQNLMQQCAQGMSFLHEKNITHRNLHTRNLMLANSYCTLKICLDMTQSSGVPVTVYTAPEALALKRSTIMSDVYSFGIVLWEVMSREIPFHLSSLDEGTIIDLTLKGVRPSLDKLKPYSYRNLVEILITQCWDADEHKRPTMKILSMLLNYKLSRLKPLRVD